MGCLGILVTALSLAQHTDRQEGSIPATDGLELFYRVMGAGADTIGADATDIADAFDRCTSRGNEPLHLAVSITSYVPGGRPIRCALVTMPAV